MSIARPLVTRRRPTITSSNRDLAMLKIATIEAASLPRTHASVLQVMGSFRIHDRPGGEDVIVYSPMFRSQFESGHCAGRWYVRPVTAVGGGPRSLAFATAKEAIDAVGRNAWKLRVVHGDPRLGSPIHPTRPRLRIVWNSDDLRA